MKLDQVYDAAEQGVTGILVLFNGHDHRGGQKIRAKAFHYKAV